MLPLSKVKRANGVTSSPVQEVVGIQIRDLIMSPRIKFLCKRSRIVSKEPTNCYSNYINLIIEKKY